MNSRKCSVIVVGAGISGLACAHKLKQSGHSVTVVEALGRVGGVMQSRREEGFLCEAGPNSFQNSPEIMDLIEEIGLTPEILSADSKLPRYIYYEGGLHSVPMGPGALLSTRLLTWGGRFRLLREPWLREPSVRTDESLADFVARRFGSEVLTTLVAPFVSGVYAGDPAQLSARSTFPSLVEYEEKHGSVLRGFIREARGKPKPRRPRLLCSFREGLQALPKALAEIIGFENIIFNARSGELDRGAEGNDGRYVLRLTTPVETVQIAAESVVLAATAYRAAELVRKLSPSLAQELGAIDYPPLAAICLAYRKSAVPEPLDGFGFLVPRDQGIRILGCIWSSSLFPDRAPGGWALLTVFIGGSTDRDAGYLSDGPLVAIARKDLEIILGIEAAPGVRSIQRYDRAIPQYNLGHGARLDRIEAGLARLPGIFLTGNYLRGVSAGDCVKEAFAVAAKVPAPARSSARPAAL